MALHVALTAAGDGPLAVRATKHVLTRAPGWPADEVWQRQAAVLREVFASADAREGAAAFAEKREPRWTGR